MAEITGKETTENWGKWAEKFRTIIPGRRGESVKTEAEYTRYVFPYLECKNCKERFLYEDFLGPNILTILTRNQGKQLFPGWVSCIWKL